MNLSTMNDAELIDLIQKASAELAERAARPEIKRVAAPKQMIIMREPPEHQKEFCLRIKTMLTKGAYIKASERQQVAEIAESYGEWVKRQGLPTEKGTRVWNQAKQNATLYKPADER
ncbi:MAG TPA: hypothetical protein DHW46_11895 [Halomonas sp.]|jgi:hypothetical protein|nr:hypothetical protein [Halomonas sp.]